MVAIIIFPILLLVIAPLIRILCHLTTFIWSSCTRILNTESFSKEKRQELGFPLLHTHGIPYIWHQFRLPSSHSSFICFIQKATWSSVGTTTHSLILPSFIASTQTQPRLPKRRHQRTQGTSHGQMTGPSLCPTPLASPTSAQSLGHFSHVAFSFLLKSTDKSCLQRRREASMPWRAASLRQKSAGPAATALPLCKTGEHGPGPYGC